MTVGDLGSEAANFAGELTALARATVSADSTFATVARQSGTVAISPVEDDIVGEFLPLVRTCDPTDEPRLWLKVQ